MAKSSLAEAKLWMAVATLVGVVIGAGILGIPYVVAKAGFFIGSIIIITIGLVFLALNLFMGEITLRTKGKHQLSGYMEKYLGETGKVLMAISMLIGIYGALLAYLIGEGQILHTLLSSFIPLSQTAFMLIFFFLCVAIMWKGMKSVGKAELYVIIAMFLVVVVITLVSLPKLDLSYLTTFHPENFLFPLGVIIFAFISSAAIPEMHEVLGKKKKLFKKAIIIGSLIPIFVYILFSFAIIGLIGLNNFELLEPNQRIATVALSFYSHPILGLFANLFAIFAMFTSFLALGLGLVEMYHYDFHFSKLNSFALTLLPPLAFALLDVSTFIAVLGITGALAGGLDGTLIILAYWNAKKHGERKPEFEVSCPRYLGFLIIAIFLFGIFYQFAGLF